MTNVIENGIRGGIMDKFKMTGGRHGAGRWARAIKAFRIIAGRTKLRSMSLDHIHWTIGFGTPGSCRAFVIWPLLLAAGHPSISADQNQPPQGSPSRRSRKRNGCTDGTQRQIAFSGRNLRPEEMDGTQYPDRGAIHRLTTLCTELSGLAH